MVFEKKEVFKKLSEGAKEFEIVHVSDVVTKGTNSYRTWKLNVVEDGEVETVMINLFSASKVLEALSINETVDDSGNVGFEWEPDMLPGMRFKALLTYAKSKNSEAEFPRLSMIQSCDQKKEDSPFA